MEPNIDKTLEDYYRSREKFEKILRLVPDKDGNLLSLPMKNCYINLAVVKHIDTEHKETPQRTSEEQREFNQMKHTFNRPRSCEEINLESDHYRIEDLFDNNSVVTRRIFMLGRAGVGKTTMCKKIVYEHYVNGLWNDKFKRIIWLPLRILNGQLLKNLETPTLSDVFVSHYVLNKDKNEEFGPRLVADNEIDETKILYILDGLDEIQNLSESEIVKCLFDKPNVIVTSRPYTFYDNYDQFDLILETIGFSQENVFDYLNFVFDNASDFQKRKEIIEFIEKSPVNIAGMVNIPILLEIICNTWTDIRRTIVKRNDDDDDDENDVQNNTHITMTRLYSILEKYLWGQFILRMKKNDDEKPELWRNAIKKSFEVYALVNKSVDSIDSIESVYLLAKVAYEMLSKNKIEFRSNEAFQPNDFGPKERALLKNTHFLHCLNPVEDKVEEIDKSYTFIHLTIQEYLAAVYLVKCFTAGDRKEFETAICHKYNPRYSIVWSFVAGILADSNEELRYADNQKLLDTFFNYLERDPVDELGVAHQYLIVNCLNECSYPSLLNVERETRLINELLSFIFTQYVSSGNSLSKLQLPLKLLQNLISKPDDFWESDAKRFKESVLKKQFLPDEIVTDILDKYPATDSPIANANNYCYYSKQNFELLISQNFLGFTTIKNILNRLKISLAAKDVQSIEMYLKVLHKKSYLPADIQSMETVVNLIDFCAPKNTNLRNYILNVCLILREIPFEIIERLVVEFSKQKIQRQRNISNEDWKKIILMGIMKDKLNFPPNVMLQLVKQKCFSLIFDEFVRTNTFAFASNRDNLDILCRFLLILARKGINEDDDLMLKLLELIEYCETPYYVKRFVLYVVGNMKTLSSSVATNLIGKLAPYSNFNNNIIDVGSLKSSERYPYLAPVILLMKSEFYERYQKKRTIFKFKSRRYLSNYQYDLTYFQILSENAINIKNTKRMKCLKPELNEIWASIEESSTNWLAHFESMGHKFLNKIAVDHKNYFVDWHLENGDGVRHAKHYKNAFSLYLSDEYDIDVATYLDVLTKYRPLVVLAHHLNTEFRSKFIIICEKLMLESLIVRALRDSKIPEKPLLELTKIFSNQITTPFNRFEISIARLLEFRVLDPSLISSVIDLIPTGDDYDVELTLALLHGQPVIDPYDIGKLKTFLSPVYPENFGMHRKCQLVAKVFENNSKLMHHVQSMLLQMFCEDDFNSKLKILRIIHKSEVAMKDILLEIPDIIKNCRNECNWSEITALCVETLLNQKKLPQCVLDKMAGYFEKDEPQYAFVYLPFLNLFRTPITQRCIEGLYKALNERCYTDVRELTTNNVTETEKLIRKVLKQQPLWKLIESKCDYKFEESFGHKRIKHCYTIKEQIVVEKILHDRLPLAIQKVNGKLCCISPFHNYPLVEFSDSNFYGLINQMYGRNLHLNLPVPLDTHHRYLKFHSPEENLKYIRKDIENSNCLLKKETINNITYQIDREKAYVKVAKDCPNARTEDLVIILLNIIQLTECRHIDLRNSYLDNTAIFELSPFFQFLSENPLKQVTTIILSVNKIGVEALFELLDHFRKSRADFVFLDRNYIFFTRTQYQQYIEPTSSSDLANPKLNVRALDLSLNFIPNGDRINGDPFVDKEIPQILHNDMKESIQNAAEIHSQNLDDPIFEWDTDFGQIQSYCHTFRNSTEPKFITTQTGCITKAEEWPKSFIGKYLFGRGHAFMVIEWIPDSKYGQRQILLADLRKNTSQCDRLTIQITNINPEILEKKLKNCAVIKTMSKSNVDIEKKLIPRLFQSKKDVDIFDYFYFPLKKYGFQGRLNCITWTDEMLKSLDISYDSMGSSVPRLIIFISIFVLIVAFLFVWIFRIIF